MLPNEAMWHDGLGQVLESDLGWNPSSTTLGKQLNNPPPDVPLLENGGANRHQPHNSRGTHHPFCSPCPDLAVLPNCNPLLQMSQIANTLWGTNRQAVCRTLGAEFTSDPLNFSVTALGLAQTHPGAHRSIGT